MNFLNIKSLFRRDDSHYSIRQLLGWIWAASKGNHLQASLNALIGLLSVAESLAQVWAIRRAIDIAAGQRPGNVYWAVGIIALLSLCSFALSISSIWVKNILGIKAQNRMQQRMFDRLLRSEWQGKDNHHSGDIINRLEIDVNHVVNFVTETIPNILSVLVLFVASFCYLFSMDNRLAIVTVMIVPVFLLVSRIYVRRMRYLTRLVRESDSQVQSILQETVQNRMLIKTLEQEPYAVDRLENSHSQLRSNVIRSTRFRVFSNLTVNLGFTIGYLIAFLWAALRMAAGTLTFGGMTAFLQLVNRIQGPARNLMSVVPTLVKVFTAAERLMELEEVPLEEQGSGIHLDGPVGAEIKDLSFRYSDGDEDVFSSFSFNFRPGTCTAVLGETGAGKTTLIRLLLALIQPTSGSITFYNASQRMAVSPRLRCNLVYVPQGNTLMSGTIRDNLLLGRAEATEEEMWSALSQACAEFVHELPDGLDTHCSESGGGLSEGQAQRIAIARALLRKGSIMLFDEATSALDPDTERRLLANILSTHNKTIIFITHRPAVVEYCDEVLTINHTNITPES